MANIPVPDDYPRLLVQLKERIRSAQVKAALSVNRELVLLYWRIGGDILERQNQAGWGAKIIDQISADLRKEFPESKGFSARNLKYMRAFAEAWPDEPIVQQLVAQIPWGHLDTNFNEFNRRRKIILVELLLSRRAVCLNRRTISLTAEKVISRSTDVDLDLRPQDPLLRLLHSSLCLRTQV